MIKRILVPVDFSRPSEEALRLATELARGFGASVTLLHVYGLPVSSFPEGFVMPPEVMTRIGEDAQQALEKLRAECLKQGLEVQAIASMGSPVEEIVERAARGVDLIVMGTHGRTGLRHVLLGSVAERVVRLARCPVLTTREAKEGAS